LESDAISKTSNGFIEGMGLMDKRLEELIDWMFFNGNILEATKILSNQLAPVQQDSIIEKLEELKKKKEEGK